VCEKKKPAPVTGPAPVTANEEAPGRPAVVTQDIMLIPRMVYVPYAPQVPVNPARLGTLMPGAQPMVPARQEAAPPGPENVEAPPPSKEVCELLHRCTQMMQTMDKRMCDLETRLQTPPPVQPIIVQPAPAGPRCLSSLFCKPHIPCLGPVQ
jgi:hypothetical protein